MSCDELCDEMTELHQLFVAERGVCTNQNGGYYQRGKSYSLDKKMFVAATLLDEKEKAVASGLGPYVNISHISRLCRVGWHFVKKIEGELLNVGHVVSPEEVIQERNQLSGPGSKTLDEIDSFVLYSLYQKQPTRSLASYVNWLYYYTGTIVSKSTVSRFFRHGFLIRGGLC